MGERASGSRGRGIRLARGRSAVVVALSVAALFAAAACDRDGSAMHSTSSDPLDSSEPTAAPGRRPAPDAPNVLLVTIDTLRADHVGAYGASDVETPHLDALARRGVIFETAIASAPLTLPSHATILTGLYPPAHGARHNGIHRIDDEIETVAERFQAAGWRTAAVIGASVLGSQFGVAQGFGHFDERFEADGPRRASNIGFPERSADEVSDRALAWLESNGDAPFFLWTHYYDPHATYRPPEPFRSRFAGRAYDGEIAFVDQQLGRLLSFLRARGLEERTLVVVTSDHGEGLGEHDEMTHAYFIYDSVLKVPLILAGPGIPAQTRIAGVATLAGVAPTLTALASLAPSTALDAGSLHTRWAEDPRSAGAREGEFAYAEGMASHFDHGWSPLFSIRTPTEHFIRAPRPELYDVVADPAELDDLLAGDPSPADPRVVLANERIDAIHARARGSAETALDAATRARIEALGYVVPVAPPEASGEDPKDVHHLAELQYQVNARFFEGRYDEALALAERGLVMLPESPMLQDMLGRIWTAKGDPARALVHARRAADAVPDWVGYRTRVAELELASGNLEAALAGFRQALAIDPYDVDARAGSVWRCLVGEVDAARADARVALEGDPDTPGRFEVIGQTLERCGEYEDALAAYQDGAARHADDPRLQMRLAIQWARRGDAAREERALARAGEARADPELRSYLAVAHAARGEFDRGEELLRSVLAEHPDHALARRFLAHLQRTRAEDGVPAATPN